MIVQICDQHGMTILRSKIDLKMHVRRHYRHSYKTSPTHEIRCTSTCRTPACLHACVAKHNLIHRENTCARTTARPASFNFSCQLLGRFGSANGFGNLDYRRVYMNTSGIGHELFALHTQSHLVETTSLPRKPSEWNAIKGHARGILGNGGALSPPVASTGAQRT